MLSCIWAHKYTHMSRRECWDISEVRSSWAHSKIFFSSVFRDKLFDDCRRQQGNKLPPVQLLQQSGSVPASEGISSLFWRSEKQIHTKWLFLPSPASVRSTSACHWSTSVENNRIFFFCRLYWFFSTFSLKMHL